MIVCDIISLNNRIKGELVMFINIERLYKNLSNLENGQRFEMLPDFSSAFNSISPEKRQDYIKAFMNLLLWQSVSIHDGIWEYYDSYWNNDSEMMISYLDRIGELEIANKIREGYSFYQSENDEYDEDNYDENNSFEEDGFADIDNWINDNEDCLINLLVRILQDHKEEIILMFQQ